MSTETIGIILEGRSSVPEAQIVKKLLFLSLLIPPLVSAQSPQIRSGATVFIEPSNGYELYLSAALLQKAVPVIVVTDKEKADYVIKTVANGPDLQHDSAGAQNTVAVNNTVQQGSGGNDAFTEGWKFGAAHVGSVSSTTASMSVIDRRSTQVVFAYSVEKGNHRQLQLAAEASAKALKDFMTSTKK